MKISFYVHDMSGGGAEKVIVNFANHLSSLGHDINIVLNKKIGPNLNYINKNIDIHELNGKNTAYQIIKFRKYIRDNNPRVIISTLSICNYIAIISNLITFSKRIILIREASSFISKNKSKPAHKRLIEQCAALILYRFADYILVNSQGSRNQLAKATYIKRSKIKVLKNPININYIKRKKNNKLPHRIDTFLDNSQYIVAVGRLEYVKGFDVLIKAFKKINNKKIKLIIVGEGSEREKLEKLINRLGLDNRIMLAGYEPNPFAIMNKSKLFVLSSRYEGMPNVLIEALYLNLLIVATNCESGPAEILNNGDYGRLVPVENVVLLANAIDDLVEMKLDNISERKEIIKEYEVEIVSNKLQMIINNHNE